MSHNIIHCVLNRDVLLHNTFKDSSSFKPDGTSITVVWCRGMGSRIEMSLVVIRIRQQQMEKVTGISEDQTSHKMSRHLRYRSERNNLQQKWSCYLELLTSGNLKTKWVNQRGIEFSYLRNISCACSTLVGTVDASSFSHKIFSLFKSFSFDWIIPTRNQNMPSGKCYNSKKY